MGITPSSAAQPGWHCLAPILGWHCLAPTPCSSTGTPFLLWDLPQDQAPCDVP